VSEHLSDFQITLLITGEACDSLRRRLSDHLADCEICCERVADAMVDVQSSVAEAETAAAVDEAFANDTVAKVMSAFSNRGIREGTRIVRWVLSPIPPMSSTALAAKGPEDAAPATLPTLVSEDGSIMIRFRKPAPDGPFRAYVIQDRPATKAALAIRFPGREDVYPVSSEGEVDLPGISPDDLTEGHLEIELHPSDDMDA